MNLPKESGISAFIRHIIRGTRRVILGTAFIASGIITLMMFLVVSDVFQRYVLNSPSRWIGDFVSEYFLIWLTMLPAAWVLLIGGHVNCELFIAFLNPKQQRRMRIGANVLGLIYSLVLAWQGWRFAWRNLVRGVVFPTSSAFPVWPAVCIIFFGAIFLATAFIVIIVDDIWFQETHGRDEK